jgi:aspartyl/asparaginyl beta-hydroxylase (cupin superfamily)
VTLHDGNWEWNSYILKGKRQGEFAVRCPKTVDTLDSIPTLMHSVPFSYAFFSTLKQQSKIAAHYGPCNIRVRCHLPLVVPDGDCGMHIGQSSHLTMIARL